MFGYIRGFHIALCLFVVQEQVMIERQIWFKKGTEGNVQWLNGHSRNPRSVGEPREVSPPLGVLQKIFMGNHRACQSALRVWEGALKSSLVKIHDP